MLTTLQIIGLAFAVAVSACVVGFIALLGYVAWKLEGVRRENEEDAADVRDARERLAEGGTIPFEELGRELNLNKTVFSESTGKFQLPNLSDANRCDFL